MKYSIIIVNYKATQVLLNCLASIYKDCTVHEIEIIVVDNFSQDGSRDIVKEQFPNVVWHQMEYNSGFARANNVGIKISKGEICLLLNSDTIDKYQIIASCFNRLRYDYRVACGVQLLHADGTPQISGSYFIKGGLNHLMALPYLGKIIRSMGVLIGVKKTSVKHTANTIDVDWINGAFLMVKKSAIEKAGFMDEDFFLYSEETEWCNRLRKVGKLCIYGDMNLIHLEGATAGVTFNSVSKGYQNLSDRKGFQIMISNLVRIRKQFGLSWYLFHCIVYIATIPVAFLGTVINSLIHFRQIKQLWIDFAGFSKNAISAMSYMPKIISNKPYFYKVL